MAQIETWNKQFRRWVNKDSKGIAVFDPKGRRNTLKYYGKTIQQHLPGSDAEYYSSCLPHTYCSNMAKSGMNPKTLQYLMGHSDIGVTLNTYTHLGLEDAVDELKRVEELENARKEMEKINGEGTVSQKMFRAI